MAVQQTAFQQFLENEVNKVKGIYYPVKAGFLTQAFVRKAAPKKLHPNPGDEFCDPKIGPNYEIISGYEKQYRQAGRNPNNLLYTDGEIKEPLMVEKTHPDGYMILNGHHRWAAAMRADMKKIRIKVINLTSDSDLQKMLSASGFERSASLDLDEVVLRDANDPDTEPPLRFLAGRAYKERLRKGIPALFNYLDRKGFDIWVFSTRYYSYEYLKYFFKRHHLRVTGIMTRAPKDTPENREIRERQGKMIDVRYKTALFIDNEMVSCTHSGTKAVEVRELKGDAVNWSREVMETIERMKI